MMHYFRFTLLIAALMLARTAMAQVLENGGFSFDGIDRSYITYVPEIYDGSQPVPLVINLHGYTSNSTEQLLYGDFRPLADTANFIIVHPDGTEDNFGFQFWNSFGTGGVDDVGFLSALIDTMAAHYNIDLNCVYSTGMSNGGFMSYTLACQLSNRIAAIASVTGSMVVGQQLLCNAQHPTPVMEIHGTNDGTVAYNGSFGTEAIEDVVAYWVNFNGCNPVAEFSNVPDIVTSDNCNAEHYVYTDGENGSSVELYKIIGGDHSWPGAIININTTCMDFSASAEIWRFFHQYKLNNLTTVPQEARETLLVYPNPTANEIHLRFPEASAKEIAVVNPLGQEIYRENTAAQHVLLSLPVKGVYVVSVNNGEYLTTQKIIVQ